MRCGGASVSGLLLLDGPLPSDEHPALAEQWRCVFTEDRQRGERARRHDIASPEAIAPFLHPSPDYFRVVDPHRRRGGPHELALALSRIDQDHSCARKDGGEHKTRNAGTSAQVSDHGGFTNLGDLESGERVGDVDVGGALRRVRGRRRVWLREESEKHRDLGGRIG